MQEQNFEKQVQKKLEELNLSPSAPVWKKVEEQIRKKKDRRRVFFWLMLFALLCGGIYFYTNSHKPFEKNTADSGITENTLQEKNNNQRPTETPPNDSTTSKDQSNTKNQPTLSSESTPTEKLITLKKLVEKDGKEYSIRIKSTVTRRADKEIADDAPIASEQETKKTKELRQIAEETNPINTDEKKAQDNKQVVIHEDEKIVESKISDKDIQKPADNNSVNNSIADTTNKTTSPSETDQDTTAVAIINETNNPQNNQVKTNTKKRWKLSASLAGGSSGIATSVFGKLKQGGAASYDALRYYSPSAAFTQNNFTNSSPVITTYYPSEIKNGFSFWTGLELSRELAKRLEFSTGLSYHYYSTSITVGKKISQADTVNRQDKSLRVENFYPVSSSGQTTPYTNSYHFIELPVGINWQLMKNIPLQLETGFRLGQLVKTNALHFDGQQSIYYEDEQLFKRTQFSFYVGLSYRILKMSKASLYIGPKAQFQLTNLLPKNDYGKQHLYFTGVESHISF